MYVGSFWDEPLMYDDNAALFDMEERDLMNDLRELPRNSAVRKINELVKRCRLAKVGKEKKNFAREVGSLNSGLMCRSEARPIITGVMHDYKVTSDLKATPKLENVALVLSFNAYEDTLHSRPDGGSHEGRCLGFWCFVLGVELRK